MSAIPGPADRPDVPEFWNLSEILLQMDGRIEEGNYSLESVIDEVIPAEVAVYASHQRALGLLVKKSELPPFLVAVMADPELMAMLGAMWIDGFIMGATYQQRHG